MYCRPPVASHGICRKGCRLPACSKLCYKTCCETRSEMLCFSASWRSRAVGNRAVGRCNLLHRYPVHDMITSRQLDRRVEHAGFRTAPLPCLPCGMPAGVAQMVFAPGLKRAETLEEVIDRQSMPIPECGCYAWLGSHSRGYAKVRWFEGGKRQSARVARLVYEQKHGQVPEGLEVDHLCNKPWAKTRWCVNPDHLEVVTHPENIRRAWDGHVPQKKERPRKPPTPPRRGQRKFRCDDCGAPYEVLAVYANKPTRYGCRECRKAWQRRWHAQHKMKG